MSHNAADPVHSPRRHWWLVIAFAVLTLSFGGIGLWKYDQQHYPNVAHGLNCLYHSAQMLILHAPHFERGVNGWIEAGRWFGAATLFLGTATLFWRRLRRELILFQLARWKGHWVICGLGAKGLEIVRCLKKRDPEARVVVLDPKPDPQFSCCCEDLGVCVLALDASDPQALEQARVAEAGEIVVITPEDETNVRIAAAVRERCSNTKQKPTPCHVHLANINLRDTVQRWTEASRAATPGCDLRFFDVFDNEARRVLLELPLDGAGILENDPRTVHVVILGFGRMGRSVALRAAKMGHFANRNLLRLSVLDHKASEQCEGFLFRYPHLEIKKICDLTFHKLEAESLPARKLIERWANEPDTMLHLFVSLDSDARDLEVALRLRELLQGRPHCTLLTRFHSKQSVAPIVKAAGEESPGIIPFGMVEDACSDDAFNLTHTDSVARAIHERFVQRREAGTQRTAVNDPALRAWPDLSEDLRESNRQQADHVRIKLRAIGCDLVDLSDARKPVTQFTPREVELLAEMEHRRWNAERWLAGWRYGTPSNKSRRINEYLVDWGLLDHSIQEYDRETVRDIPLLAALLKPAKKVVRMDAKL